MTFELNVLRPLLKAMFAAASLLALSAGETRAGIESIESKEIAPPAPEPPYEAGRGLLTLQGPTGMFINPTSATLPQGSFTIQYCNIYVNTRSEVVGHGWLASYGITDWLELGGLANVVQVPGNRNLGLGGPLLRVRLLRDKEWWPQLSIGFYGKYGTNALQQSTVFLAAYKRIPIDEDGFFKSFALHVGIRESWYKKDFAKNDSFNAYGGAELQLPYRVYLIGEIGTKGNTPAGSDSEVPYAFGLQWRLGAVNISLSGIQDGTMDRLSIFYGVGTMIPF